MNKTVAKCNFNFQLSTCKFSHSEKNNIQLIHLCLCWLLKTKWMLAGQIEESTFVHSLNKIIDSYPEDLGSGAIYFIPLVINSKGKFEVILREIEGLYYIITKFPLIFDNFIIINIGTLLLSYVYALLSDYERKILIDALSSFKNHLLIISNDASTTRLKSMFAQATDYFQSYYNSIHS